MININLFGGPCVGKSVVASELFVKMKKHNYKVELLSEYAKDLTYGEDNIKLSDQIHILGEQHHRLFRLKDKVDYVIHDSPILLGVAYSDNIKDNIVREKYIELCRAVFDSYNNFNVFLSRNMDFEYQEYGRNQNVIEAINKDYEILKFLNGGYEFHTIINSDSASDILFKHITQKYN